MHNALPERAVLARIGGEEFLVLLPGLSRAAAHSVAERLRERIATLLISLDGQCIQATVSVGLSHRDSAESGTAAALLRIADRALYAAKTQGRNRVIAAG
jgi:diguanylate cyclase (GGDEF)-like protein